MLRKKPIKVDVVTIFNYKGKAYIPSIATYPSMVVHSDPVYLTKLCTKEMAPAIERTRRSGWKELMEPESREVIRKKAEKVILKATKTHSWKELAGSGSAYMIAWTEEKITLSISQLDKRGRYEFPKSKQHIFPLDTPLDNILEIILADVEQRNDTTE